MPASKRAAQQLDADLRALQELPRDELASRWEELFGFPCPRKMSRIFLVRALAHRIGYKPSDEVAATFTIT